MQMALSSLVLVGVYSYGFRKIVLALTLTGAAFYGVMMMIGWRGYPFAFIAAAAVGTCWHVRRIKYRFVIAGYLVFGFLWLIVASVRDVALPDRDYDAAIEDARGDPRAMLLYPIQTLASQETSLRFATRYVDEKGIGYGSYYLTYLKYALPNVISAARDAGTMSEEALAWIISVRYSGYGLGLTPIGEAYCNFGTVGVCVVLFIVGVGLGSLDRWAQKDPCGSRLAILCMVGAAVFWWLRNDSMQLVRFALWGIALHASVKILVGKSRTTRRRPNAARERAPLGRTRQEHLGHRTMAP